MSDGSWLRVFKAQVPPPPNVSEKIRKYLRTRANDPRHEPTFASDSRARFWDRPEDADRLEAILGAYVEGPRYSWAADLAKHARRARDLYDRLFELQQRLQRHSALIELFWGHGILSWLIDGTRIVHPLVTSQVQLSFGPETGSISVEPEAFVTHRMEINMLQALQLRGFDLLVKAQEEFRVSTTGPFDMQAGGLHEKLDAPFVQDWQFIRVNIELSRRFQRHVPADINHLKASDYNPTLFLCMVHQRGGAVVAAKSLRPREGTRPDLVSCARNAKNQPRSSDLATESERAPKETRIAEKHGLTGRWKP